MLRTISARDNLSSAGAIRWDRFVWLPALVSLVFFVLPIATFLEVSLHRDTGLGLAAPEYSFANYKAIFSDIYYLRAIWRTTSLSVMATVIALALAAPTAFALSRASGRMASFWLNITLTTSLITVVIKLMGLNIIFGPSGPINELLRTLSIIDRPLQMVNNDIGVLVGLVQYSLPILILLLFGVAQTIPKSLEEAAEIYGASRATTFRRVVLPLMKGGLVSGGLIAFNMSMGAFTSAVVLGGGRVLFLPVLIQQHIIERAAYGMGAALAMVLLVFVLSINILVGLYFVRKPRGRSS